jgi:hypothetical protein
MLDSDRIATDLRVNAWQSYNGAINRDLLIRLQNMISEVNPFYRIFRTNRQQLEEQNQQFPYTCRTYLTRNVPRNALAPVNERGQRQIIQQPVNGEIAAVFDDRDGLPLPNAGNQVVAMLRNLPADQHTIRLVPQFRPNQAHHRIFINNRDPNCDPLTFPLLFPYGEAGYDERFQHQNDRQQNTRITLKEFYRYKLHPRQNNQNLIFYTGKLLQEYVVSSYVKIETNNLNYLRANQDQLRIMEYEGIINHFNNADEPRNVLEDVGRPFILPSTYEVKF